MDDYGIKPIAPPLEMPDEEIDEIELDKSDIRIANEARDSKFPEIETMIIDEIERLSLKPSPALLADEYKIHSLGDERARGILIGVMERIHNAVAATESKGDA